VPTRLDDVVWRCLDPEAPEPLTTPAAVAEALSATGPDPEATEPPAWSTEGWPWIRMGLATVGAVVLAGAVLFGLQVWQDATRPGPSPTATATGTATATTSPSPTGSTPDDDLAPVAIVSARAFDPAGDGEENDELAAAAVDGDPTTAWLTVTYATRDLGQLKPGVGLLLDLGVATGVSGVELELVGRGTDLQVLASDRAAVPGGAANPTRGFEVVGAVRGAGDAVTLRTVEPVSARWVLVWLTGLPVATDGYRGGVAEVVVLR
jgi:putative peptidoglycan lipid II flippase